MDNVYLYSILLIAFFLIEINYLSIARYYKIVITPSQKSSHTQITITGAGIIFPIACLVYFFLSKFQYPFFFTGLILISLVSFIDDIMELSIKARLLVHLISICLLLAEFDFYSKIILLALLTVVIIIISINAYNFLDGINGITASYSLVQFITFYYINHYKIHFIDDDLLIIVGLALIVFTFLTSEFELNVLQVMLEVSASLLLFAFV